MITIMRLAVLLLQARPHDPHCVAGAAKRPRASLPKSYRSLAAASGQHRSNIAHPVKRIGAAPHLGELRWKLLRFTRYGFGGRVF